MTLTAANPLARLYASARTAVRRRRGSILILVVALLVLLLIIGTAFLATSRTERIASIQDQVNTQGDLLLSGVENVLASQVAGKLFTAPSYASGPNAYRFAANALARYATSYDAPASDLYLGSRIPTTPPTGDPLYVAPPTPTVLWQSISLLPTPGAAPGSPLCEIDGVDNSRMPLIWAYSSTASYRKGDIVTVLGAQAPVYYTPKGSGIVTSDPSSPAVTSSTDWTPVEPKQAFRFIPVTTPVNGQSVPAIAVYNSIINGYMVAYGPTKKLLSPAPGLDRTTVTLSITDFQVPAADADGDGVPDAGFVKLPVGQIDGVTYYAAVRVIDGNSAVNASTAWRSEVDYTNSSTSATAPAPSTANTTAYLGMFRSNVGLRQLLWAASNTTSPTTDESNILNKFRFNSTATANFANASVTAYPDTSTTAASDFTFLTEGDGFESQLVRRPLNPGKRLGSTYYQWFGQSLTAALANRFCLNSGGALVATTAETALANELTKSRTTAWGSDATSVVNWFNANFNFATTGTTPTTVTYNSTSLPLRPVLVGNNAVSNAVSGHYVNRGTYDPAKNAATIYYFGDWVTYNDPANPTSVKNGRSYVCVYDGTTGVDPSAIIAPTPVTPVTGGTTVPVTVAANKNWEYVPWNNAPVKASANASTFGQLWASYWNVMWDHPYPTGTLASGTFSQSAGMAQPAFGFPLAAGDVATHVNQASNNEIPLTSTTLLARMFRNPIRDPGTVTPATATGVQYMTPGQVMVLRSAAAALNTISLRQASGTTASTVGSTVSPALNGLDNVISRQITIPKDPADPDTTAADNHAFDVMLFGATKQPYISEVYAQASATAGSSYLAIELVNPYPVAMKLTGWQIGLMKRTDATAYKTMNVAPLSVPADRTLLGNVTVPAANAMTGAPGFMILSSGAALPPGLTAIPAANVTFINSLATDVGDSEYVLLRPRSASGTPAANAADPNNTYDEGTAAAPNLAEMVPVDQIDASTLTLATPANVYTYRRADDPAGFRWNFVYPGKYSVSTATPLRHDGWKDVTTIMAISGQQSLGTVKGIFTAGTPAPTPPSATYQTFAMQVANTDSAGFNQAHGATGNQFPFGGFARNGDLLQVPFTCGYRVLTTGTVPPLTAANAATTRVIEFNSLPMDCAFVDAQDANVQQTLAEQTAAAVVGTATIPTVAAPFREQIGRFCPVGDPAVASATGADFLGASPVPDSTNTNVIASNTDALWRYHWARRLFDFVTVQAPHDDYMPNVDPYDYTGTLPVAVANRRSSVANAVTPGSSEDTVGIEGLVNLNTAPFPVLAAIPFFPAGQDKYTYVTGTTPVAPTNTAADNIDDNANLAQAIVDYRNANGPFKSPFDLYKVPFFKYVNDQMIQGAAANEPGKTMSATANGGDFSPNTTATDGVRFDFEERFLLLNRVSNLLTTHSDTFTCYVLLQGYRNVDSGQPTLVVQRRAAFLLDRNVVTPTNRSPSVILAPTN